MNPNKCVLGVKELDFLGHHIDQNGITPLQSKVQAILDFPQPTSQRQLQRFMGMINFNFYHRFIPHGAELLHPLHALINPKSKAQDLNWDDSTSTAFLAAKQALANATLLVYPQSNAPICVITDASDIALGAVLQQYVNNSWQPISFFSKKMKSAETKYSTFDRELLAVYLAIRHFRYFLERRQFHVLTDHKPLTFALQTRSDRHSPTSGPPTGFHFPIYINDSSHPWSRQCCSRHPFSH